MVGNLHGKHLAVPPCRRSRSGRRELPTHTIRRRCSLPRPPGPSLSLHQDYEHGHDDRHGGHDRASRKAATRSHCWQADPAQGIWDTLIVEHVDRRPGLGLVLRRCGHGFLHAPGAAGNIGDPPGRRSSSSGLSFILGWAWRRRGRNSSRSKRRPRVLGTSYTQQRPVRSVRRADAGLFPASSRARPSLGVAAPNPSRLPRLSPG